MSQLQKRFCCSNERGGWNLQAKRIRRTICFYTFYLGVTWPLLFNREHETRGPLQARRISFLRPWVCPLNAYLQTGQRESWAIKDRVGCGGHMSHLAPLGLAVAKSTNREGVVPWTCHFFRLVPLTTPFSDSRSHHNYEWGSLFLGVTSWNNLIPSLWAVHIEGPGDFSGACLAEPELHSPIRTLSNFCTLELTPTIR